MSNSIQEIIRFQEDRDLHKQDFNLINEQTNFVEELLELESLDISKDNRKHLGLEFQNFIGTVINQDVAKKVPEEAYHQVDALCDLVVFAIGGILKLGHEPETALLETAKEINSRRGTMVGGKFEKDLSQDAQSLWYKADYTKSDKHIFKD